MPKITFIEHNGTEHHAQAEAGQSVMQVALNNGTPGIIAECGGCCTCATCHGYVDDAWLSKVGPKGEHEDMMLEGALEVRPNSRLTCQIVMRDELDGLVVRLPASQL